MHLARHAVLDEELAVAVRRAVGFRNVLIHEYVTVDDSVVTERLTDLSDLRQFVRSVAVWMDSTP